ncbi:MAG: putative RNA-binding Zn-ribbon protein involved in translation (DUF1610 family) [Pirellulaceae bacterium]|jgi:predicted RNA-binding Zn-ribbon protein involved in translation (DUF1610 family)
MADLLEKCTVCGAMIDEEDLFCANCGTEAPDRQPDDAPTNHLSKHNFGCGSCGASMSYDASAQNLLCPFCGSEKLEPQEDEKVLVPRYIVPFRVDRGAALGALKRFLGSGFWRPGDLASAAQVEKVQPVFVPYWVFKTQTHTYWTADTSETPWGASGDWAPISGEHRGEYNGLLIGASGALHPAETAKLCPFDLGAGVEPERVDLTNYVVEKFRVQRKYARPLARQQLTEMERNACSKYVPGRARNVHVNLRLGNLQSQPVLLPVWIMSYRYNEKLYRFLINGQSGEVMGNAPLSYKKMLVFVLILIGIVLALMAAVGIIGGLSAGY